MAEPTTEKRPFRLSLIAPSLPQAALARTGTQNLTVVDKEGQLGLLFGPDEQEIPVDRVNDVIHALLMNLGIMEMKLGGYEA